MARKQGSTWKTQSLLGLLLLLLAVGAIAVFQTDLIDRAFAKRAPSFSSELLDMIKVSGAIKVDDLRLSSKEIRKINVAAMKARSAFSRVDISFNMEDKFAPIALDPNTKIELGMVLKSDDNGEVKCWTRTIKRKRLVSQMVRAMNDAVTEFQHYRKRPGAEGKFKRLYM